MNSIGCSSKRLRFPSGLWAKKQAFASYLAGIVLLFPLLLWADFPLPHDGKLKLYSYHHDEFLSVEYEKEGKLQEQALKQIEKIFRSHEDNTQHAIDPNLIRLLDHIQDHFAADTVEIISGFRSLAYNAQLKTNGHNVASESYHTKGFAADIHLDEISERDLWEYVKSLHLGGAGYYPRFDFVHVDVGPRRIWQEADSTTRQLIGTENNKNVTWSATTNKNIYKQNDSLELTLTNQAYHAQKLSRNIWLEGFREGKWQTRVRILKSPGKRVAAGASKELTLSLSSAKPGKYRLVVFADRKFKALTCFIE